MISADSRLLKDGPPTCEVYMFDPVEHPPPKGQMLLLVNPGGVLIKGHWTADCLAWMYHPKVPESVKRRRSDTFKETESS